MTKPAATPVKFLLVDDLEENLLALDALLRRDGLELLKARSGTEALEFLLAHEVALALIDVQMPEMDGFELAELMRGTERTRRVPIIFLTAGTPDRQRRFRGYDAGAVDFLTKPIETHALKSKADVFFELWRERQEVARLLDETRRTAEALREADRRKDEFLATLAHELRNPLAPLTSGLAVLKAAPSAPAADRARDMMERQLKHMVRLIDDLMDIARVSSGKIRLQLESLDLRAVVEAAVEATRPLVEAGGHSLRVVAPAGPVTVEADPTRLTQVVGNLITNAAKYTPAGGRIEVSVARGGGEAVLRVADNGLGIPADMLPKVFDLFTQVGRHLDRSQGGLGIGLALVQKLVEMHGGRVWAESDGVNLGSTFTVRLPLAAGATAPAAGTTPEVANPRTTRRVLIVDDNADGAESLALMLSLAGHTTEVAGSGAEALVKASAFRPDVAFLDIGLPGMSGYEVAKALRASGTGVTLVAVTGWGSEEDRRRSRDAGFDFHLTKPVEPGRIHALLSAL